MRTMMFGLLLAGLLPSTKVHAGACAQPPQVFAVLTAPDTEISSGGAIVAQLDDLAKAPAWRFEGANKDVVAKAVAPGLATIDVPVAKGWLTLDDAAKAKLVRVRLADKDAAALKAPDVTSVVRDQQTGRRGTSVSTTAHVKSVPTNAIALVVFGVDSSGARAARSWALVKPGVVFPNENGSAGISIYSSGSCQVHAVGWTDSNFGDKIELAWLDASGRLSKSTQATVAMAPGKPGQQITPGP